MKDEPAFLSTQVTSGEYYFLNLTPKEEFTVVCGGYERCALDYRYQRLEPGYIGIELIVSGKATVMVGNQRHEIHPGSLFGYAPETMWTMESHGAAPLIKYYIGLYGNRAAELFEKTNIAGLAPQDFSGVQWIEEIFRQLSKFGATEDALAARTCTLLAEALLLQLAEESKRCVKDPHSVSHSSYLRCRKYLRDHFLKLRSATELAEANNVDPAYLSRLFRQFDNESPYKRLIRLKMNHAARILLDQEATVKEVADAIGYEDQLHFSRTFKRSYGVSPKNFRKSTMRG